MLIIGLTGGIGSGKTTVSHLFQAEGVEIIDTDEIAHKLSKPGQPAFNKIIAHFGHEILDPHGEIDRKKLASLVFSSSADRVALESILHPLIREEVINQLPSIQSSYCIVVVPLLIESRSYDFIDRILVVDIPESLQIERVVERDNRDPQQAKNIITAQVSRRARLSAADDIIDNDVPLTQLRTQVTDLHKKYLEMAKSVK